jgi:hypothetical protein
MNSYDTRVPLLYARETEPFGRTWEEWVELWWKWCYAKPESLSPVADNTGLLADGNQNDPNVWFLAGTFGGEAERSCAIQAGRSILLPLVNDLISYAEYGHLKNEEHLSLYAKTDLDTTTVTEAMIDGLELWNLRIYRVRTSLFYLLLPIDTSTGISLKYTGAVSDGYWLFLQPLTPGSHTVTISGEKALFDNVQYRGYKGENGRFKTDVIYHLTVR